VLALAMLTVLNLFDLAFTHTQLPRGNFAESNLVVRAFAAGPAAMAAYKLVMFGGGAWILYHFRRHRASELAVWGLTVCYVGLMWWWVRYLDAVECCLRDHSVNAHGVLY
jgi:hypothetical protein